MDELEQRTIIDDYYKPHIKALEDRISVLQNNADSPALKLLKLAWASVAKATPFAWRDANGGMQEAMDLAIKRGFIFHEGDMEYAFKIMKGERWFGVNDNGSSRIYGEGFYANAIQANNASAYKSFEAWQNRKPFIIDGKRLYLRYRFDFRGERLTVTSFDRDGEYVVAVSHHNDNGYGGVKSIYKITHADIYAWNKERREAEKETR